jgi:DNA polymerase beta
MPRFSVHARTISRHDMSSYPLENSKFSLTVCLSSLWEWTLIVTAPLSVSSRRGLTELSSIEVMVLHPDHVHIPVPAVPPPVWEDEFNLDDDLPASALTPKRKRNKNASSLSGSSGPLTKKDRESILLHSEVVPILQQRGVLCEKLSETRHSWTGVVRLPSASSPGAGQSGSSRMRAPELHLQPGDYRRITFQ